MAVTLRWNNNMNLATPTGFLKNDYTPICIDIGNEHAYACTVFYQTCPKNKLLIFEIAKCYISRCFKYLLTIKLPTKRWYSGY